MVEIVVVARTVSIEYATLAIFVLKFYKNSASALNCAALLSIIRRTNGTHLISTA